MSVYIKGMEMPTRCAECWLMDGEDSWCTACRGRHLYPEYRYGIKDRPDWCPLVHVPEHGRLIDADVTEAIHFTEEDAAGKDFYDGILYAAEFISKQPTIIPADHFRDATKMMAEEGET